MTTPSFERINYALRPAKNIERKMFCETFARLSRISPLAKYRYIGFGSIGFHDFNLFHQRLGINDMISIEGYEDAQKRVKFNRPYSCIRIKWGLSHIVIPTLSWPKKAIVWLDYDFFLDAKVLADVNLVVGSVKSGSIIFVTVDAEPLEADPSTDVGKERLNHLKQKVGKPKVPPTIEGTDLAKWGTANACREIINNEILQTLGNRNAPIHKSSRLRYHQLFNFHYADGAKMLSVGGIFLNPSDQSKLSPDHFSDLHFVREDEEAYHIEVPKLTYRELHHLDSQLPTDDYKQLKAQAIPERDLKRYAEIYRYFPNFAEVEP